jgi:hypothetical protein
MRSAMAWLVLMGPFAPLVNVVGGEGIGDMARELVYGEDEYKVADVAVDGDAIGLINRELILLNL